MNSTIVSGSRQSVGLGSALGLIVFLAVFAYRPADANPPAGPAKAAVRASASHTPRYANFGSHLPTRDVRRLADWIADSGDNESTGFFLVDKRGARLYAFDRDARLTAASAVLLGAARGDDSVPGIGSRPIASIKPAERTTPAGRFVAQRGHNTNGDDIVWIDYDSAVSMHRVRSANPRERRLERLASPTAADKRISYGCVNVPAAFYDAYVGPAFAANTALIYVLPEVKSLHQVFGSYDVAPPAGTIHHTMKNPE